MGGRMQGRFPGEMTEDFIPEDTESESAKTASDFIKEYSTPIISMILLALAFVFVIFYKRKRY